VYDASGNLQSGLSTGVPPSAKTLAYNQAGQLSTVSQGTTLLATYTYDWRELRTRKALTAAGAQALGLSATAVTIVYHYDLWNRLIGETTTGGSPIRTYIWRDAGSQSVPVAQIDHPSNTAFGGSNATAQEGIVYFDTDDLGTPRQAYNAAGQTVWLWAPDAFGASLPNETVQPGFRMHVNLRFPGQYFDGESGLHYNQQRVYDPTTGRYVHSDPIGLKGGFNTYAYVYENPLTLVDPDGTQEVLPWVGPLIRPAPGPAPIPFPIDPVIPIPYSPADPMPQSKGRCKFIREVYYGGPCKTCWYQCPGYGGPVTYPQAVEKACPGIGIDGLVDTSQIDEKCRPPSLTCAPHERSHG
jgi:RHS repeat-associated protein